MVPKLLQNIKGDESEEVVGDAFETIGEIMKGVAPNGTHTRMRSYKHTRANTLI